MTRITSAIGLGPLVPMQPEDRLCRALAEAFGVSFIRIGGTVPPGLAGIILADGDDPLPAFDRPVLTYVPSSSEAVAEAIVTLAADASVDVPFRDCGLVDDEAPASAILTPRDGERVLAMTTRGPIWCTTGGREHRRDRVTARWPQLAPAACLRDIFCARRFFDLLPLVHFLAGVTGKVSWRRPSLRATFLLDDPNLHASRYGYLHYGQAVEHARGVGYHLALATVPLDTWYSNGRTAELFRDNPREISLLIHGNNHVHHELGREHSKEAYTRMVAQGLRRIDRIEAKQQVPVAKVMAAPHGRCHENAARALLQTGYDAICISRPFPWLEAPPVDRPLTDWYPAEFVAGGLPVLPRHSIQKDLDDLRFRAWLGHPLVVYGHHQDVASGLDVLESIAARIDTLGAVAWAGLGEIVKSNHWTRVDGEILDIMMFSSRAEVLIPPGIEAVRVSMPAVAGMDGGTGLSVDVGQQAWPLSADGAGLVSMPSPCCSGDTVKLGVVSDHSVDYRRVASPPLQAWPVIRRLLTETRDRVLPLLQR